MFKMLSERKGPIPRESLDIAKRSLATLLARLIWKTRSNKSAAFIGKVRSSWSIGRHLFIVPCSQSGHCFCEIASARTFVQLNRRTPLKGWKFIECSFGVTYTVQIMLFIADPQKGRRVRQKLRQKPKRAKTFENHQKVAGHPSKTIWKLLKAYFWRKNCGTLSRHLDRGPKMTLLSFSVHNLNVDGVRSSVYAVIPRVSVSDKSQNQTLSIQLAYKLSVGPNGFTVWSPMKGASGRNLEVVAANGGTGKFG